MAETQDKNQLQPLLPRDIKLGERVADGFAADQSEAEAVVVSYSARDLRAAEPGVPRLARFVDLQEAEWAPKFRERVRWLMTHPLPHVARPLEAGLSPDGLTAWLILESAGQTLAATAAVRGQGLADAEVVVLLRQLLEGLAALHDAGQAHGDVRPENIVLAPPGGPGRTAWLTGVETGWLAAWTGKVMAEGASHFFPPEWKGAVQEPTGKTDVYAVGLVACELLLGAQGNPRQFAPQARARDLRPPLRARLKECQKSVSAKISKVVIERMLDPNDATRPADARRALEEFDRAGSPVRRWLTVSATGLVALAVLVLLIGPYRLSGQIGTVHEDVQLLRDRVVSQQGVLNAVGQRLEQVEETLRNSSSTLQSVQVEVASNQVGLRPIYEKIVGPWPNGAVDVDGEARKRWLAAYSSPEFRSGKFKQIRDRLKEELAEYRDEGTRPQVLGLLEGWLKDSYRQWGQAFTWFSADAEIVNRFDEMARDIWNQEGKARKQFEDRLAHLEKASELWKAWAADDGLALAELEQSKIARQTGEVGEILNQWLDDYTKFRPRLVLLEASSKNPRYGMKRRVGVWTTTQDKWSYDIHEWEKSTTFRYPEDKVRQIKFTWTPGDELFVLMEGETYSWHWSNMIQVKFAGPLALWKAAQAGQVSEGGCKLSYRIDGGPGKPCPGPPISRARTTVGSAIGAAH